MSAKQAIKREVKALACVTLYFACWIGALLVLKHLLLAEYDIASYGYTAALVGALLLAKVVLILEHAPLARWIGPRPAWVDVVARTVLYAFGVVIVMAIERGVRGSHEHGGFLPAVRAALGGVDAHHVWVNALCITGALLGYNALAVVRLHVGRGEMLRMFLQPLPHAEPRDEGLPAPAAP